MLQERLESIGLPLFSGDLSGNSRLHPIIQWFFYFFPPQRHPIIESDIADVHRHAP